MENNSFLITGARVWNGVERALSDGPQAILVRAGRIAHVGPDALEAGGEAVHLDCLGRFVMPGLIDSHVHLELDPALRTPAEQLAVEPAVRDRAMRSRASAMLRAGITTTRDCGGGAHREMRVRDEIATGTLVGPRVLCCGQPLTSPGGHCAFWGGEVSTRLEIQAMVARQIEAGSDWIKVMATGGVFTPGSRARDSQFELSRLTDIVEAADRAGRSVAAHCHGKQGIADALRAGVRTIEHASFAGEGGFGTDPDESLMAAMAEREMWVSPTVNIGWGRRIEDKAGRPTEFFKRMSGCLRAQRRAGVRFIASTDAGIPGVGHADLLDGLIAFARFADLRPIEVLRSATSEAAIALGLQGETGRIAPGLAADLLVLDGDPSADLEALREPAQVIARGRRWIRDQGASASWNVT